MNYHSKPTSAIEEIAQVFNNAFNYAQHHHIEKKDSGVCLECDGDGNEKETCEECGGSGLKEKP